MQDITIHEDKSSNITIYEGFAALLKKHGQLSPIKRIRILMKKVWVSTAICGEQD
jgi:hypothetical protein